MLCGATEASVSTRGVLYEGLIECCTMLRFLQITNRTEYELIGFIRVSLGGLVGNNNVLNDTYLISVFLEVSLRYPV